MATTRAQTTPSNKETLANERSPSAGLPSRSPSSCLLPSHPPGRHLRHTSVNTYRVTIEPTLRTASRQFYRATYNGQEIVARSWDPEFDACRALKARGLSGRVEFFWEGVLHPCLIVRNLARGARLHAYEDEIHTPALRRWQSSERDWVISQGSPSVEASRAAFAH